MSSKHNARERAEQGVLSIAELRAMIALARGRGGQSRVNPTIPLEHALDIYEAALAGREDSEVPAVWRPDPYSKSDGMKPTKDVLIITNILRDST
jgi:hypothetical protein